MDNYIWYLIWFSLTLFLRCEETLRNSYLKQIGSLLCALERPVMLDPGKQPEADFIYEQILSEVFRYGTSEAAEPRLLSVSGKRCIGRGVQGEVYELNAALVAKVYDAQDAQTRRHAAALWERVRWLRRRGLPVAEIRCTADFDGKPGLIMEYIRGEKLTEAIRREPAALEEYGRALGRLFLRIHRTCCRKGLFPEAKEKLFARLSRLGEMGVLERWELARVRALVNSIPGSETLVYQEISFENMLLRRGELVLLDPDEMALGHPIYDLVPLFLFFHYFSKSGASEGNGLCAEDNQRVLTFLLMEYYGTEEPAFLSELLRLLQGYGLIWMMYFIVAGPADPAPGLSPEQKREMAIACKTQLFSVIDTLYPVPESRKG